jgi:hypothetical protein
MSRSFIFFFSMIALVTPSAWAVKRALVIGGATSRPPSMQPEGLTEATRPKHEFARAVARTSLGLQAKGYEVTTLFDSVGVELSASSIEALEGLDKFYGERTRDLHRDMRRDFDKLAAIGATTATEENVLASLRSIRDQLSAGDEFELSINAHGYRFCPGANGELEKVDPEHARFANNDPNCIHKIGLTDPKSGADVLVETSKIHDVLKEIDAKGVRTNLNFLSCHSGQTQNLFGELPNTCTVFAASGNNVGMMCMPDDAPSDLSFTTALDAIQTSHFIGIADRLLADPYFSEDPCTAKMLEHYRRNDIGGANRYDLFMAARKFDRGFHEPTISSQIDQAYFSTSHFSTIYRNRLKSESNKICSAVLRTDIDNLLELGQSLGHSINVTEVNRLRNALAESINFYDQLILRQKDLMNKFETLKQQFYASGTNTPEQREEITQANQAFSAAQDEALAYASTIMEQERNLVDFLNQGFLRDTIADTDPCVRN